MLGGKDYGGAAFAPFFKTFQQLESFHSLAHAPPLLSALHTLFGEPALVHPRHIARVVFPNVNEGKTMPHQVILRKITAKTNPCSNKTEITVIVTSAHAVECRIGSTCKAPV